MSEGDEQSFGSRSLTRVVGAAAPATLLVQATSFFSSVALADQLGATPETDAYYLALGIPVLVYGILLAGLRLGAIPSLTAASEAGEREFSRAVSSLITWVLVAAIGLALVSTAVVYVLLPLMSGEASAETISTAQTLVLELSPMTVIGALVGAYGAILTVRGRYVAPIAVGVAEPLLKIIFLLAAVESLGVDALVLGNLIGGAISVGVLHGILRREGVAVRPTLVRSNFIRGVLTVSAPLMVAEAVLQVNPIVDRLFAAGVRQGGITALELGQRLFSVPLVLVASTLIAPVVASWSQRFLEHGWPALQQSVVQALDKALLVLPPVVAIGFVLREPLTTALYLGGEYSSSDVAATADVFGYFILSLPAQVGVVVFASLFVVVRDTRIPAAIAVANVILNLVLNALLVPALGLTGIALSTTLSVSVLSIAYVVAARRRHGALRLRSLVRRASAVGLATAGAAVAMLIAIPAPADTRAEAIMQVAYAASLAVLLYLLLLLGLLRWGPRATR